MPSSDLGAPSRPTVLVVDDTLESLRFLTSALESAGLTVLIAVDGQAALTLLQHVTPNLILMDAVMPNVDGFETTRRIKADPAFQHLPIIFMTGLTETEDVVRGLSAGAIDYVTKPIVIDELLARIHGHLASARVSQGSQLALDTAGRPALAVDASGDIDWLTPLASDMLERLFPGWTAASGMLPAALRSAIGELQAGVPTPGRKLAGGRFFAMHDHGPMAVPPLRAW